MHSVEIKDLEGIGFATASNVYDVYSDSHDKDDFERVIDGLILEKYATEDIKKYIKSLPNNQKRIATLSIVGDDHILWSKINDVLKSGKKGYDHLKEVYFLLRDYVKIADVERKKHGEILTPFKELAEPMVKLVEKYDPDFWKNPNHKVLDSSAGYGTFLILSAYKFMIGLKDWEPDEDKRFKWIVENCLYYGELQAKSVFSWLVAIDPYDEFKTNIYWGSFLTEDFNNHAKNVWGVEKWDLIIQNPPYQEQKDGFVETQQIWPKFVEKSLKLIQCNKYMVMVHPSGWRNVDGSFKGIQRLLKQKQILEISIHDEREGEKTFGATTGYDYYILKNFFGQIKTKISSKYSKGELDLSKFDFVPGDMFDIFDNLIAKINEDKVEILHDYKYEPRKKTMSKNYTSEFRYPCIYTIQKNGSINFRYSNIDKGHFGIPKVIWSNGKASAPIVDMNGNYGLTGFAYGIIDKKENLDKIKISMNSDLFIRLMKSCDMNDGNRFNKRVLSLFRKDFWKIFYNDISEYKMFNIERNDRILIIGCGLSGEGIGENSIQILMNNLVTYKNIRISDYKINDNLLHCSPSFRQIKDFFPVCWGNKFLSRQISIDHLDNQICMEGDDFKSLIEEKYIKIDLLNNDYVKMITDKYDYIELRYVLHFMEFKNNRIGIIKQIYDSLNKNGKIGIQCYYELSKERKDHEKYSFLSDSEIDYLRKNYKCEIRNSEKNGNKYYMIIIEK